MSRVPRRCRRCCCSSPSLPSSPSTSSNGGRRVVGRWIARVIALAYLLLLLVVPVGIVFFRTFRDGFSPFWDAVTTSQAEHAFRVTVEVALFRSEERRVGKA